MTVFQALVLGVLQGVTEFLPVSSSAHLVIAQYFFGLREAPMLLLFDVVVHAGTLCAILIYFGRPSLSATKEADPSSGGRGGRQADPSPVIASEAKFARSRRNPSGRISPLDGGQSCGFGTGSAISAPRLPRPFPPKFGRIRPLADGARNDEWPRMLGLILVAALPTAAIGFLLKGWAQDLLTTLRPVSIALLVNSVLLWSTRFLAKESKNEIKSVRDALIVGIIQGISVLPGISRSGSTITAALWLGVSRAASVRFSFLIAIPAILGATALVLPESLHLITREAWPAIVVGFIAALVSGYAAIGLLFRIISSGRFHYFAYYTLALSGAAFCFSWLQS